MNDLKVCYNEIYKLHRLYHSGHIGHLAYCDILDHWWRIVPKKVYVGAWRSFYWQHPEKVNQEGGL